MRTALHRTLIRWVLLVAVVSGLAALAPSPAGAAPAATPLPTAAAVGSGGWNDWGCRTTPARPRPVVLLHGLGGQSVTNWVYHAPKLAADGYCVFSPTYGEGALGELVGGLGSMRDSAAEVAAYVDRVQAATGAAEVDLVGHSEGTTVAAYYLKFLGGAADVAHFVGFGSNFAGTSLSGLNSLVRAVVPLAPNLTRFVQQQCAACLEFLPPNQFLTDLGAGGVTVPGVQYTSIVSRYDSIVTPYTSGNLSGPNARTIVLQDVCGFDLSGHLAMAVSPNVNLLVRRALSPEAPPALRCRLALPAPI